MRSLLLVAALLLMVAVPAHADVWDFSWTSNGIDGHSTATITPGRGVGYSAGAPITIGYDSPSGPESLEIIPTVGGTPRVLGSFPFFIPDPPPGCCFMRTGWTQGHVDVQLGLYTWTGAFDHPDSFTIPHVAYGGDPGIPMVATFTGTGVLENAVSAVEPHGILAALAVLVGLRVCGRSRHPDSGGNGIQRAGSPSRFAGYSQYRDTPALAGRSV